jgi:hypothetical protein
VSPVSIFGGAAPFCANTGRPQRATRTRAVRKNAYVAFHHKSPQLIVFSAEKRKKSSTLNGIEDFAVKVHTPLCRTARGL